MEMSKDTDAHFTALPFSDQPARTAAGHVQLNEAGNTSQIVAER